MRLLMTAAARELLGGRLDAMAPDLELVLMDAEGRCSLADQPGQALEPAEVRPDLVWLSTDTFERELLPSMFGVVLDPAASVRWIQTFNAGLDNPVWKMVMERGTRLCKSSAQAPVIAEYVMAHALSLIVPVDRQRELQADHSWERTPYRDVGLTRWVIVGFGPIGQELAARLAPFEVHLTVVRRSPEAPGADAVTTMDRLHELLPEADVVVLACASNDETRGMADEAFFAAMAPGSILINIGRGDLVDEDALRTALDRSRPATAVLDVTGVEPLPEDSWLWDHPAIRLSAHTSSAGAGTVARGTQLFLDNLRRFLADQPLLNEAPPSEVGITRSSG